MTFKELTVRSAVLIFTILLFVVNNSHGQSKNKRTDPESSWEIGLSGGLSKFLTSVIPNSDAFDKNINYWNADFNSSFALSVIKNFSPKFSAAFEWQNTKLSGSWNEISGYAVPQSVLLNGLSYPEPFKTGINQFSIFLTANLNKIIAPNFAADKWNLFVTGGGGSALLNDIRAFDRISGSRFKATLTYGAGLSYNISENIKIKLGTTWYVVDTYHLDGVHVSTSDNLTSALDIRERYYNANIGMTYAFGDSKTRSKQFRGKGNNMWIKSSGRKKRFKR